MSLEKVEKAIEETKAKALAGNKRFINQQLKNIFHLCSWPDVAETDIKDKKVRRFFEILTELGSVISDDYYQELMDRLVEKNTRVIFLEKVSDAPKTAYYFEPLEAWVGDESGDHPTGLTTCLVFENIKIALLDLQHEILLCEAWKLTESYADRSSFDVPGGFNRKDYSCEGKRANRHVV
jgi:hypothetical protein